MTLSSNFFGGNEWSVALLIFNKIKVSFYSYSQWQASSMLKTFSGLVQIGGCQRFLLAYIHLLNGQKEAISVWCKYWGPAFFVPILPISLSFVQAKIQLVLLPESARIFEIKEEMDAHRECRVFYHGFNPNRWVSRLVNGYVSAPMLHRQNTFINAEQAQEWNVFPVWN
jgi:hypothetical protein